MNRRNFLKTSAMGYIVISLISFETSKHLPLETIYPVENFIPVLTEDELIDRGIRSSRCFASSVDKNGIFAHEPEYDHEHSEPFIRKTYILKSIPNRLWKNTWKEKNHILEIIRLTVNLRKNEYLISKVIDEVKEHMEYVCMIAYAYFEEVPSEAWAEKIVPVVMGLPKCKYNKLVENLNS